MARQADCVVGACQTFFAMSGFPKTIVANASRYVLRIDAQCGGTWWARFTNQFVFFVSTGKTSQIAHARRITCGHGICSGLSRGLGRAKRTRCSSRFLCIFTGDALSTFFLFFFLLIKTTRALETNMGLDNVGVLSRVAAQTKRFATFIGVLALWAIATFGSSNNRTEFTNGAINAITLFRLRLEFSRNAIQT